MLVLCISLSIPPSMPHRSVSLDLKARIPILRYSAGYSAKEICGILGIRKSLVYQTLQYYAVHGVCYNPNARKRGQHRKLTSIDINFIKSLISEHHTIYLDEIQEQLLTWRGVFVAPLLFKLDPETCQLSVQVWDSISIVELGLYHIQ